MSEHSKLPWTVKYDEVAPWRPVRKPVQVLDANGLQIVMTLVSVTTGDGEALGNTEFMVRAVNSHADLLAALENLVCQVVRECEKNGEGDFETAQALAAIRKATTQ